jgi:hypothetical protein
MAVRAGPISDAHQKEQSTARRLTIRIIRIIPNDVNRESSYADASTGLAEGMARICRLYGVAPVVGRLYAALFLSPRPLSLDELVARVGAAKSTLSVGLRTLVSARVARRLPPRGDRRDFYEAVTDPWAVLADWNTLYLTPELEMFRDTGEVLEAALGAHDAPAPDEAAVLRERLRAFRELAETMSGLLASVPSPRGARPAARRIPIKVEGGER